MCKDKKYEPKPGVGEMTDKKQALMRKLVDMHGEAGAHEALKGYTSFTTEDGNFVEGTTDILRMSNKWVDSTARKVAPDHEEWCQQSRDMADAGEQPQDLPAAQQATEQIKSIIRSMAKHEHYGRLCHLATLALEHVYLGGRDEDLVNEVESKLTSGDRELIRASLNHYGAPW